MLAFSVGDPVGRDAVPSVNPQISMAKPEVVKEEPLRAELRAFLECIRTRSKPAVTLEDGRRALQVALDIVNAIHTHAERNQLQAPGR